MEFICTKYATRLQLCTINRAQYACINILIIVIVKIISSAS